MNFVDSTGRIYGKRCGKCKGKVRESRADGAYICADHNCGVLWPYIERHIFKGEVKKSKRPSSEFMYARWLDVGVQLHFFLTDPLWRTNARVYVAYVMGFSVAKISAHANDEFWGTIPGSGWSRSVIYERKDKGRREWIRRLSDAGIPFDL